MAIRVLRQHVSSTGFVHHSYVNTVLDRHRRKLTHNQPFDTTDSLRRECGARSDCTYVQSDLTLHSRLIYNIFAKGNLSVAIYPVYFRNICRRQRYYVLNTVYGKSRNVFCAKPKEVNPIKLYDKKVFRWH